MSAHTPKIMAILNLTPDSFYDGGRNNSMNEALAKVEQYLDEGADIIDIGAYSSRPGAEHISEAEELKRLMPVLTAIQKTFPDTVISIDTFRSQVAYQSAMEGAQIINDISGGLMDQQMFATIAKLPVHYILMHMQGTPQTMQQSIHKGNITKHLQKFFKEQLAQLKALDFDNVILDIGLGFGKTLEQNYELLKNLTAFEHFGKPLLVGLSRKSMLYKPLGITPQEALNATSVAHTLALLNGADYLRVHDVKACREVIDIVHLYLNQSLA